MKPEQKFLAYYRRLNSAQKEAVDTIEGPVMVTAGPGTGKTQVLTLRIANILRLTDTAPANILALTFTESGVISMRRRLAEIIGSRAYAVIINTFHGFCQTIIKDYPEDFPRIIGSRPITEVDQAAVIENLIKVETLKILKPFGDPLLYVRSVLSAINDLKREGVFPEDFLSLVKAEKKRLKNRPDLHHKTSVHKGKIKADYQKLFREIDKNEELARLYRAYQEKLTDKKLYDYSDMIMEVLLALKANQTLKQVLQEEYQYILVDEHQDTNNAQNQIIEILCSFHNQPNLFVVGDEKQAIFRFQGASLENFLYFKCRFPTARLIALEKNYRAGQILLDSAENILPGPKPLKAAAGQKSKPIKIAALANPEEEVHFIAGRIKEEIEAGQPAEAIAVLYRDNRDAFLIASTLEKLEVPFVIESDEDLLTHSDIKKLLLVLEAVENFGADRPLAELLHIDLFKLRPLVVYRLIRRAGQEKKPLIELLSSQPATKKLFDKLETWRREAKNLNLLTFFERLVRGLGLLEDIIASPATENRFEIIRRLYDEIAGLLESHPEATLADFLDYLKIVKAHKLLIRKTQIGGRPGKVRLMTAHRSKGLEFDIVYIIGAHDGHFGGRRNRQLLKLLPGAYWLKPSESTGWRRLAEESPTTVKFDDENDEQRLFYVALTRARREVIISYSRLSAAGRGQLPSVFITEIKSPLKETVSTEELNRTLRQSKNLLFAAPPVARRPTADKDFVQEIFTAQGLSVTALNNYLICPWRYFYRNLIRLPEPFTEPQIYGTAVHDALRDFFAKAAEKKLTKKSLLSAFCRHLAKAPLPMADFKRLLDKGQTALAGWHDAHHKNWSRNVLVEFKIGGVLLTPDIRLVGKLDKVEFISGGVRVVDYKTRQPLSRKKIMGGTTDEDGSFFRQLVFYKLLLDLYENGKYQMTKGVIDFIEPNPGGRYKQEVFVIDQAPVGELKKLILKTVNEIITLKFWNRRCSDKKCYYCGLRDLIRGSSGQAPRH